MGFAFTYRTTRPVSPAKAEPIKRAAERLCHGRTWLSCEPVFIDRAPDGHLSGSSKPSFGPDPADAAAAAREGLPDGTSGDVLDILCQLSREHGVDWEISHDYSEGPVGYIRKGVAEDQVVGQMEALSDLGDIFGEAEAEFEGRPTRGYPRRGPRDTEETSTEDGGSADEADADDDDGPPILPFRPRGE